MEKSYFSGFYYIEESPDQVVLKRKWRGFLWYLILVLAGAFASFVCIECEYYFWLLFALLLTYLGLCGLVNVVIITINKDFIDIKQKGLPIFGNVKIDANDFAFVSISKETSKTGRRMYSTSKGFYDETAPSGYDFQVYKRDGRSISIVSFAYGDIGGVEFLKSKIESFIPNQPLLTAQS